MTTGITADAILKGFATFGSPFLYTTANWGAGVKFYLEVYMRFVAGDIGVEGVHARLLNITDNTDISGSEISMLNTTMRRLRTPELTLTNGKEYRVQFGKCGSDQGAFLGAKLVAV